MSEQLVNVWRFPMKTHLGSGCSMVIDDDPYEIVGLSAYIRHRSLEFQPYCGDLYTDRQPGGTNVVIRTARRSRESGAGHTKRSTGDGSGSTDCADQNDGRMG